MHWDRKLRNMCALDLVRRLGGKAAPILLPLWAEGRLYASCSSKALLEHEDPALIRYLKSNDDGNLLLQTKYHANLEAKKALREAEKAKRQALKKQEKAAGRRVGPPRKAKAVADSWWSRDPAIPVLKTVAPQCAEYIYRHWILDRGMDDLYTVSQIPKRSGGMRQIEAPCASLKMVQRGILNYIFGDVRHHDACHGFRSRHSIATNAALHVGKDIVLNLDLQDFFPSVAAGRVYGIFKSFVGEGIYARFLTDVSVFKGRLPQGAPTSPMIANLTCLRLDRRLAGLANKNSMDYTRYADDLTFSGPESIIRFIPAIKAIIAAEGFRIALPKLRIHRKGSRQEVTGLTVNQQVSVPRVIRRRLRAAVHASTNGTPPTWKGSETSPQSLEGHINFISSIHPDLGSKLLKQLNSKTEGK